MHREVQRAGGKLRRGFAAMCCAVACTGCQTLWDASGHVASDVCAPPAPYEEADPELEASSPEVRELVSVAHAHHLNGEPALAASALLDALEFEPDNRRVRTMLAITLALEGHIHAAELQFIEALGMAEAQYNLGIIIFEQGHVKAAEQRFLRAVQHDSSLQDARVWLDVARRKLAVQAAMWHTEIQPLPAAPRQSDVRHSPPPWSSFPHRCQSFRPAPSSRSLRRRCRRSRRFIRRPGLRRQPSLFLLPLEGERGQGSVTEDERKELERLREEVHRLRLEHEILKKAIGVIAADEVESDR